MRRLILCLAAGCTAVVLSAGTAPAKSPKGTTCVLHAKLTAKSETTGSTSVAKGHTLIKVRANGTIQFRTKILNRAHETFFAGHIHEAPVGSAGSIVVPLFVPPASTTSALQIKQSGVATPNAGTTGAELCQNPSAFYVNYHTTAFTAARSAASCTSPSRRARGGP